MIGTNEMSSTSMDIGESFRPEDLAKADFFDFVTAPDMGIGIGVGVGVGVGVSMVGLHHPHLHQHHNHHNNNTNNNVHERTTINLAHDSAGDTVTNDRVASANVSNNNSNTNSNNNNNETGNANNNSNNNNNSINSNNATNNNSSTNNNNSNTHNNSNSNNSGTNSNSSTNNSNNNDPTLQGYEFWHTDKDQNRLDSSIFEDLDRYCWQQQQQHQQQQSTSTQQIPTPTTTATLPNHNGNTTTSSVNTPASSTTGSISQPSSASSLDNTDGQIYTLTVLNGSESWLKREPDSQLGGTLDLDSLLGNFPGYIKSEYPYDESGFSNENNKTANRADPNGLDIPQVLSQHSISANVMNSQNLPPLISALSGPGGVATGTDICNSNSLNVNQQLALFQNNNNDWHMADHNAEQNSAESLLRSALQGKGYSKGINMQNGIALLPSSPSVKDDEMRRILFSTETETLGFADSTLSTTPIFDDPQNPAHNSHMGNGGAATNANTMIVDDMFLSLENVFNDDFEKIKRIANEVQQYCNAPPDYASTSNDVMMQIAAAPPPPTATTVATAGTVNLNTTNGNHQIPCQMQQQALPTSSSTTTTNMNLQARSQQLKSESVVSTSTAATPPANRLITPKINKKYKRSTSMTAASNNNNNNNNHINNNNNNNPNVINNNNANLNGNTGTLKTPGSNISSGGSNSSNSSNSPTQCNGQRKERSLHYCSICAKGFKDKYSVNVHIRTHTGEKPFACSLCGKSFRQKAHLAKHYQTHMAQKNNGNLVKGNNAKHARHHNTVTGNSATSITTTPPHRNLANCSTASSSNLNAVNVTVTGNNRNSTGLDMLSVGVPTLNGAINTSSRNVLPPANGLLANR